MPHTGSRTSTGGAGAWRLSRDSGSAAVIRIRPYAEASRAGRFTFPNLPAPEGSFASVYTRQIDTQFDLNQFARQPHRIQVVRWRGFDMHCRKVRAWLVLMLALITGTALAQQPQHDEHHPPASPAAAGPGMPGAMARYVEGRLAFLKTELKITDAQLPLWNAVADAIRANAKSMGDMAGGRAAHRRPHCWISWRCGKR